MIPQVGAAGIGRASDPGSRGRSGADPRSGLGAGEPGPDRVREVFRRLGVDLDPVRLHTGPAAGRAAHSLGAQAFTLGHDVVFGEGRYDPGSRAGLELLVHELVHVGEHGAGRASRTVQRQDELPTPVPTSLSR